jgi:Transposase and inactivated derivatives
MAIPLYASCRGAPGGKFPKADAGVISCNHPVLLTDEQIVTPRLAVRPTRGRHLRADLCHTRAVSDSGFDAVLDRAAPSQTKWQPVFAMRATSISEELCVFKGRHFDRSVIVLCVRWYLAYNLSLRDLEEMMAERGVNVDHSTVHRWVIHFSPQLAERFNRRKRGVSGSWPMDETYIKVRGRWMYLYRAVDSIGDTVEFFFSEHQDLAAAKCFLRKALARHGRPDRVVIDGSQTNHEAIRTCDTELRLRDASRRALKPIRIRTSQYLNDRIEQDHRRVKRRIRPMLGFKSLASAQTILTGIELVHMMRKQQARFAYNPRPSLREQFELLAA